ncbi:MAG: ComF family protein [Caldimonas sp.]
MPVTRRSSFAGAARQALPPGPSLCAVCHGWGAGRVCASCLHRFAGAVERCHRCALPVPPSLTICGGCLTHPPAFDAALACVDYGAPWDLLITAFKFHDALDLAPVFARAIAGEARRRGDTLPQLVLPVPLAAPRLRERGYNQAWEVARRAAKQLGIPADATLLLRIRDTAHQLALPPPARAGNVRGAFAIEPLRRAEVVGRRIAIVDDVMTTGSTAAEIAAVLRQAGAAHIAIWVFARTPRPGEG